MDSVRFSGRTGQLMKINPPCLDILRMHYGVSMGHDASKFQY